ncbi:MAG: hypothetical protein CMJ94_06370 [Planctomycetes bacterium]|nr:hypothetical protein [Planctomycetota bacterium]
MHPHTLALLLFCCAAPWAGAQIPYAQSADYESYPSGIATGGGFADINGDGFLDLVVANGNDIQRQKLDVFYNDGTGRFPTQPSWSSADRDYHGHLAIGDVNADGWPDVAVSVFLGSGGFGDLGHVKLYLNQGGALESLPSWRSADEFYSFSCAFGDADGDGDLDLAVATGEPYFGPTAQNRIYFNAGGSLNTAPGWLSNPLDHTMDVAFGDVDNDGDLDLAFATAKGPTRVFYQGVNGMSTTAGFTATDNAAQNGNTCHWVDLDADGFLELAVSDNDQLSGGSGNFKVYGNSNGALQTTPIWSDFGGYVSSIAAADLLRDGYPEIAGGLWWGGAWIYNNATGQPGSASSWESAKNSVSEAIFFGDLDNRGLREQTFAIASNGGKAYRLPEAPVHRILGVSVDGVPLARSQYCADPAAGWVALDRSPQVGVQITAAWSDELDMGMTNWDSSVGNQLWYRSPIIAPALTALGSTTLMPGDALDVRLDLESTAASSQDFVWAVVALPPAGPYRVVETAPGSLAGLASQSLTRSYPIPAQVPPGLRGSWELLFAVFRTTVSPGSISAEARLSFSIL